jgi:NO-binding membrane sensor protein with MHYT domain
VAAIVLPALAVTSSIVGSLLGVMLATKARTRRGRDRVRLLVYAALALGGTGIWQTGVIATLTFDAGGSPVRYDPWFLAAGGVTGVGLAGLAFATMCREVLRLGRLVLGGLILATAIGATNYVLVASIRVAGSTEYDPIVVTSSGAIAILPALAAMWFVASVRRLRMAVLTATAVGAGVCATDFVSLAAVRVRLDPTSVGTPGLDPLSLGLSVILFGSAGIAMLWFFTLGTSTVGDVEAILACEPSVAIEPWLIREILARTSSPVAPTAGLPAAFNWRPQPPSIEPVMRTMLIWGASPNSRLADPPTNGGFRRPSPTPRSHSPVSPVSSPAFRGNLTGESDLAGRAPSDRGLHVPRATPDDRNRRPLR